MSLDTQEETKEQILNEAQLETKSSILSVTGDDDLLFDEENDFFWVLQNIFWNALKSLFIIFVLVAIIWVVWRPNNDEKISNTKNKTTNTLTEQPTETKKKEEKKTETKTQVNSSPAVKPIQPVEPLPGTKTEAEQPVVPAVTPTQRSRNVIQPHQVSSSLSNVAGEVSRWHNYIEQKRVYGSQSSLYEGSWWIKQVDALYDSPMTGYIDAPTQQLRQQNINQLLGHMAQLLEKSFLVRSDLYADLQFHNQRAANAQTLFNQYNTALTNAYNAKQTGSFPSLIEGKAQASKDFTANQAEADVRRLLIQHMEQYDKSVRSLYEVIYANQAAIAQDIRVVNFPSDPFGRVLTPAQWRSGQ